MITRNLAALGIEQELLYVGNEPGKLLAIKNIFKQVIRLNFNHNFLELQQIYVCRDSSRLS